MERAARAPSGEWDGGRRAAGGKRQAWRGRPLDARLREGVPAMGFSGGVESVLWEEEKGLLFLYFCSRLSPHLAGPARGQRARRCGGAAASPTLDYAAGHQS